MKSIKFIMDCLIIISDDDGDGRRTEEKKKWFHNEMYMNDELIIT